MINFENVKSLFASAIYCICVSSYNIDMCYLTEIKNFENNYLKNLDLFNLIHFIINNEFVKNINL